MESVDISVTIIGMDGSSSSSLSSSSSISSSSSADTGGAEEGGEAVGGGYRGAMTVMCRWPEIVRRIQMPDGSIREEILGEDEARRVERCYIDGETHPAAPLTHYKDVPAGIWYEEAVASLLQRGALDARQSLFRGEDASLRAEIAAVLTRLKGDPSFAIPLRSSFDDVPFSSWYHPYTEQAGERGWMKGYNDCFGTRPCRTRPLATATRAEAIAMIVRTYGLRPLGAAPAFEDVPANAWFADEMQIAADSCILRGDEGTRRAAPDRLVNRAEMAALFVRAEASQLYGRDCGLPKAQRDY